MQNLDISNIKAVVFDWDNTLAKSSPPLRFAVSKVLDFYDLPSWDEVKQTRDGNLSFRDNFPIIFKDKADEAYERYKQIYLKVVPFMITRTPCALNVLNFFKKRHIPVLLMTNKDRTLLEFELPLLFEPEYFDCVVCGHEATKDKPHGDHLMYTLSRCGLKDDICLNNVLVVGDSPQDSRCALECGAKAVRIGPLFENETTCDNVLYFNSFVDFYQSLLLSNS
ncbi:MAG: HAD family hydrolase [Alphaproteobacteria bacterium]|nr:HAD family hydrolase [Alphaproteobacteria bacterium]